VEGGEQTQNRNERGEPGNFERGGEGSQVYQKRVRKNKNKKIKKVTIMNEEDAPVDIDQL
jgi:hypothetical protein